MPTLTVMEGNHKGLPLQISSPDSAMPTIDRIEARRMAMMWNSLTASGCLMVGLGAVDSANAHPPMVPTAPLQRLSADLARSPTQDFFKLGRLKLEREVQIINQPRSQLDVEVLIINPNIPLQPNLSPLEIPLRPSSPPNQ